MTRRAARFTQAEVARAVRAVAQTGARATIEIDNGVIRIIPAVHTSPAPPDKKLAAAKDFRL